MTDVALPTASNAPAKSGAIDFQSARSLGLLNLKRACAFERDSLNTLSDKDQKEIHLACARLSTLSAAVERAAMKRAGYYKTTPEERLNLRKVATIAANIWDHANGLDYFTDKMHHPSAECSVGAAAFSRQSCREHLTRAMSELEQLEIAPEIFKRKLLRGCKKALSMLTLAAAGISLSGDSPMAGVENSAAGTQSNEGRPVGILAGQVETDSEEQEQSEQQEQSEAAEEEPSQTGDPFSPTYTGEEHHAGINSNGRGHRDRKEEPAATFTWLAKNQSDGLWRTSIYARFPDGKWRTVEEHAGKAGSEKAATVTASIRGDLPQRLPAPTGFIPADVSVNSGKAVSVDSSGRVIRVSGGETRETVRYTLRRTSEEIDFPFPSHAEIARDKECRQIIQQLAGKNAEARKEILTDYLRGFTYITSSDLHTIFMKMPGRSMEEIISNVRVGDCDTMSVAASGLLSEAGHKSGVAAGIQESNNTLKASRAHAKLLMLDDLNSVASFECTDKASASFQRVKLLRTDREKLIAIVAKMSANDNAEQRVELYRVFREQLHRILLKPYYRKFTGNAAAPANEGDQQEVNKHKGTEISWYANEKELLKSAISAIASFGLPLSAAGLLAFTKRSARKEMEEMARSYAFSSSQRETDFEPCSRTDPAYRRVSEMADAIMLKSPVLQGVDPSAEGDLSKKLRLYNALNLVGYVVPRPEIIWDVPRYLFQKFKFRKTMKKIEEGTVKPQEIIKEVNSKLDKPASEEELKDAALKMVKGSRALEVAPQWNSKGIRIQRTGAAADSESSEKRVKEKAAQRQQSSFNLRNYEPGDDVRRIAWAATARTGRLILKGEEPALRETNKPAIDCIVDPEYLQHFCAFLLNAAKKDSSFSIDSVTFICAGEVAGHIPEDMLRKALKTGPAGIVTLIKYALKLNDQSQPSWHKDWSRIHFSQNLRWTLPPAFCLNTRKTTVLFSNHSALYKGPRTFAYTECFVDK